MMDCKRALEESDGDFDKAVEILRIKGAKDIGKRAERTTANGLVAADGGALIELDCETDFVAKNDEFQELADGSSTSRPTQARPTVDALRPPTLGTGTVDEAIQALSARDRREARAAPGRQVRRPGRASTCTSAPPTCRRRSACWSQYTGDRRRRPPAAPRCRSPRSAKYVTRDEVPADVVDNERRIAEATAREEGKPEAALPKIVEGRRQRVLQGGRAARAASVHGLQEDRQGRCWTRPASPSPPSPGSRSARPERRAELAASRPAAVAEACRSRRGSTYGRAGLADDERVRGFRRVVLKLGGEMFGGGEVGVDPDVVATVAGRSPRSSPTASRSRSSSAAATSSAAPSCTSAAWTGPAPTTWACSAR